MAKKKAEPKEPATAIKLSDSSPESFIPTGCTLLDCVLGGGWGEGRVANLIGNPASGKSLVAIESAANFLMKYPEGTVHYIDAEHAFDPRFASNLGIPLNNINLLDEIYTVEQFASWLDDFLETQSTEHSFIVLDSLDALSDDDELNSNLADNLAMAKKARQMSRFFRQLNHRLKSQNVTLLVISQVRDKLNVSFGQNWSQSGGKALEFYMSQRVFLKHMKRYKKTSKGVERTIGVQVEASCEKNKVGVPFRKCKFPVLFDFGIDDIQANLDFADDELKILPELVEALNLEGDTPKKIMTQLVSLDDTQFSEQASALSQWTRDKWAEIESRFVSVHKKYST